MIARLTRLLLAVPVLGVALAAQTTPDRELVVRHSFPEAGDVLRIVVEGFTGGGALISLEDPAAAPPSVREYLLAGGNELAPPPNSLTLTVLWPVDERGLLRFVTVLDDADDVDRFVGLRFTDAVSGGSSAELKLLVQPPMLWLPTADGLARIDMRDGRVLAPSVPGDGGFLGAALSDDGLVGYVLREEGRLEVRSADRWDGPVRSVRNFDAFGDDLAHGPGRGPAFVVVRPTGSPFTPAGRVAFVEDGLPELELEPLGADVDGRRWAVSDDGLSAFVAEDDLLVREVDLLTRERGAVFTAGVTGDESIADIVFTEDRLLVITRRSGGRSGTLTVYDLNSGWLTTYPLRIDPRRLIALEGDRVLVVPHGSSLVEVVRGGVPDVPIVASSEVLDATSLGADAMLLEAGDGLGQRVVRWSDVGPAQLLAEGVGPATRIVGGDRVAVLLGAPDGAVQRLDVDTGDVQQIPGLRTDPSASFATLP